MCSTPTHLTALGPLTLLQALPGLVSAYLARPDVVLRQALLDPADLVAWAHLDPSDRELWHLGTLMRIAVRERLSDDCEDCADQHRDRWHDESWRACGSCGNECPDRCGSVVSGAMPRLLTVDGCQCVACGMLLAEEDGEACEHCGVELVADVPRVGLTEAMALGIPRPVNDTWEEGA